jgi:hypothetical protein
MRKNEIAHLKLGATLGLRRGLTGLGRLEMVKGEGGGSGAYEMPSRSHLLRQSAAAAAGGLWDAIGAAGRLAGVVWGAM